MGHSSSYMGFRRGILPRLMAYAALHNSLAGKKYPPSEDDVESIDTYPNQAFCAPYQTAPADNHCYKFFGVGRFAYLYDAPFSACEKKHKI